MTCCHLFAAAGGRRSNWQLLEGTGAWDVPVPPRGALRAAVNYLQIQIHSLVRLSAEPT